MGPHEEPGHGHSHDHGADLRRAGTRHKGRLAASLAILVVFLVVEVATAIFADSLALLSDAGHLFTDVLGMGMALAAIHLADQGPTRRHQTFGLYRLEILAALANAALLSGVAVFVLIEAVGRLSDPPEVRAGAVLVVAVAGLLANLVVFGLLRAGSKESLNIEGAYLEVLADTLGSAGVIVGAAVMAVTDWWWVDPVVGIAVGLFILPRTWRLGRQALRILLQAAPPGFDLDRVEAELEALEGVVDVHDLHAWTLTSEMEVVTAHVMVCAGTDTHAVLDQARALLSERYGITHATLQIEPDDHRGCDEIAW